MWGGAVRSKIEFESTHKFSIAFENTSQPGYTTEKIMQSFAAGCIPIYWGNPRIEAEFNPAAFVNVHRYDTIDMAIERVIEIDNNEDTYRSMLEQPAVLDQRARKSSVEDDLSRFLDHVFRQNTKDAQRISHDSWNKRYLRHSLEVEQFYEYKTYIGNLKTKVARVIGK